MGILRSVPDKQIHSFSKSYKKFDLFGAEVSGWQYFKQDCMFSFQFSHQVHVIGILDGQSGPQVAQFCQNQIPLILKRCDLMKLQQYQAAIQNLCFSLDQKIKQSHSELNRIRIKHNLPQLPKQQHTPSSASLIIGIVDEQSITIGNLGQCRSYVSYRYSKQKAVLKSGNHIVQNDEQKQGITKKGGFIVDHMINGKYVFNKCLGNMKYKNLDNQSKSLFSSQPSIFLLRLQDLNYVIMGSSGIWQRSQLVLKTILSKKLALTELQSQIKGLISELIAQSPEQQYGKRNMSLIVLIMK